jgi:hypothetical protein
MSRVALLAGLAMRELWISFRLLGLLTLLAAAALPVVLLPPTAPPAVDGALPGPMSWYALAAAAALACCAGVAAWSLATMRRRGTAAWLAARAVPRASVVVAWFVAVGGVVLLGLAAGAGLAWFALGSARGVAIPMVGFEAAAGAVAAAGLLAVGTGLVAGSLLSVRAATLLAIIAVLSTSIASVAGWLGSVPQPLGGLWELARLEVTRSPVATGLVSAGLALAVASALLTVASAAFDRGDL